MADEERLGIARRVHEAGTQGSAQTRKGRRARARDEALQHELNGERAGALGRAGRKLENALAALDAASQALDAAADATARAQARADYDAAWQAAASARWEMRVHREALGLRDHRVMDQLWPRPTKR